MTPDPPRDNLRGGAWLLTDLSLNIWALSIVKAIGLDYPAWQIVLIRAGVGLVLITPWIWLQRGRFRALPDLSIHLARVVLSAVALTASFFAIARVPLALFTAVGFIRPLVTMLMVAVLLKEPIGRRRWLAAGVALVGVLVALGPVPVEASAGLWALPVVVLTGSGAIVATRRLRRAPAVVLMAFYTAGLTLVAAPLAAWTWQPVAAGHVLPLLAIGVFAQVAQLCFLRAHFFGEAGVLAVLSYLSLPLSVGVGVLVFEEVPEPAFYAGAALVIGAALFATRAVR